MTFASRPTVRPLARMDLVLASGLAALALAGCAGTATPAHDHGADAGKPGSGPAAGMAMMGGKGGGMAGMHAGMAVATLGATQGNTVQGVVVFHAMGDRVMAHARVTGLKPGAEHGFHVHDKGDCASPDGMSAGGHYNPAGKPHGEQASDHHAGDMPNLKADANGVADQKFMLPGLSVGSGAADVVGRAVILHAGPDDYKTQPTGNSGARLACGVIAKLP
ncbi:MAG: superoxide dismutase family protein [Burkholderiales bacterium]